MAVTILEALQNAQHNLTESIIPFQIQLGKRQLKNAVVLLEKGYDLEDEVEPLLEEFGDVDNVPDKEEK